jgi:uncharacterized protein YdiU (UPF0061 family)
MEHLLFSLSPLVALEGKLCRALAASDLDALSSNELEQLSDEGEELAREPLKQLFMGTLREQVNVGWRARLGLTQAVEGEYEALFDPLLDVLEDVDFATSLRALCDFPPLLAEKQREEAVQLFTREWLDIEALPHYLRAEKTRVVQDWLAKYAERLSSEARPGDVVSEEMKQVRVVCVPLCPPPPPPGGGGGGGGGGERRVGRQLAHPYLSPTPLLPLSRIKTNPRFVLRNWVTDEVVRRLRDDSDTDFLLRVLHVSVCFGAARRASKKPLVYTGVEGGGGGV